MFSFLIKFFTDPQFLQIFKWLYFASYFFIPAVLVFVAWELWVDYVRALFFAKTSTVVLEIKLPKEIFKSPKAMEFCIAAMHQLSGEKNWYEKYWQGKVRAHTSLEMVSIGGSIHFFIWTRKALKNVVEANLYSQYPGVEIYEVPDYTLPYSYNPETHSMWVSEFKLDKADYFPIKTYVDYGMDKDPEEEYKIDPLTPLIEFMGSVPKSAQIWIQIIIRAHKAEDPDPATGKMVDAKWAKASEKEIEKIVASTKGEKDKEGKLIPGTGRQLTEVEKETITALARSVSKKGFDVGIRALYFSPKDVYDPANIGGVVGGISHFNSHLNGFKPENGSEEKWKYLIWKDRSAKARDGERQEMLDAYKRRAYFYRPYKRKIVMVLNSEELATIYHFPGSVSSTPSFSRIESKKSQAPSNIPV